ncbi:hypothetical protein Fcan01_12250 [Folsomia candida]|uniref:Uncharacterized protein n=1 Tax=Folsomia candida TaxID=158441 RepID=A0A226E843_FOLCA|nr:hypothetical protein Fcan01_12250 [Folsomia candida]
MLSYSPSGNRCFSLSGISTSLVLVVLLLVVVVVVEERKLTWWLMAGSSLSSCSGGREINHSPSTKYQPSVSRQASNDSQDGGHQYSGQNFAFLSLQLLSTRSLSQFSGLSRF